MSNAGHLSWLDILEGLERGDRPPHLGRCPACEARWQKARAMLDGLRVEEAPPEAVARATRRALNLTPSAGPWFAPPRLRWAAAAALVLCLAGAAALWQVREKARDERLARILSEDLSPYPGGLDFLLPRHRGGNGSPWGGGLLSPFGDQEGGS
jgi:hypothetical protein